MAHQPRKRFGQNFLQNQHVIDDILRAFNPQLTDNIVEIGPGLGALTIPLLRTVKQMTAVEIDRDLVAHLKALPAIQGKVEIINKDALTLDYHTLGDNLRIIGNLPYNISTPLLLHLLTYASHISDMHFMLQKEVVERLAAGPGSKAYGRLSVAVQYQCEVQSPLKLFTPNQKLILPLYG
jgi:16S rRNA (adenine1518-N6/adenine1519-N6)-dimethyltransferase